MRIGKLDNDLLREIVIDKITFRRPEVKTRPGIGEDCAVIDFGEYDCVLSTDPITATSERIGSLAVHVSCNDIAAGGVEPLGLLLSVLLPPETTEGDIAEIMEQAADAAAQIGVEIIGGHTEITPVVKQPVITATAIGRAVPGPSPVVKPGDRLIVTKLLAMEGTGIIAATQAEKLTGVLTPEELSESIKMLDSISVVTDGVTAARAGASNMHDITEGGVLGAIWEVCELNGVGAEIREDDLPIAAVTRKVCAHFGLDPLRLISSGSMLIVAPQQAADPICAALADAGIRATEIGIVTEREAGVRMARAAGGGGDKRSGERGANANDSERGTAESSSYLVIEPPESDDIYKL